jgi:hypothetical protein
MLADRQRCSVVRLHQSRDHCILWQLCRWGIVVAMDERQEPGARAVAGDITDPLSGALRGPGASNSPSAVPVGPGALPGPQEAPQRPSEACGRAAHLKIHNYQRRVDEIPTCPLCQKPRCVGWNRNSQSRCSKPPSLGLDVCLFHGGSLPHNKRISREAHVSRQVKQSIFWDPDVEPVDAGDALAQIAARLMSASEHLGGMLDEQMQDYAERRALRENEVCPCCGIFPPEEILDKQILSMFQFCAKESASLFTAVEKLGLREREIELKAGQVALLVGALTTMMDAMGVTEAQQIAGRKVLIDQIRELEVRHGVDGELPDIDAEVTYDSWLA